MRLLIPFTFLLMVALSASGYTHDELSAGEPGNPKKPA
jgi:hypothetical protein